MITCGRNLSWQEVYNLEECSWAIVVWIIWQLDLQLLVQSVTISTKVVSLNNVHGEVYSIQHLCDKVCQRHATGLWFSPGTPVSSTNKTDCHDITEILLSTKTLEESSIRVDNSIQSTYIRLKGKECSNKVIIWSTRVILRSIIGQQYLSYVRYIRTRVSQCKSLHTYPLHPRHKASMYVISGAETANLSGAPEFIPVFELGSCYSIFIFCIVF